MDNFLHTVWLSLSCTPGLETFSKLLNRFSSPEKIYDADGESIASCIGSRSSDYNLLIDKRLERAERIIDFCKRKNIGILTYFDDKFPDNLRKIKNPPVLLYYRGVLPDFNNETFISIVGTRLLTDYGKKNTFSVSCDLARAGAVIVSGMAIGIDGVAHSGALAAGKKTVAILGCGIDICYPIHHRKLAQNIVKCGCVITEYAPGTRPDKYNFPIRNRLISGLSEATLIIEGRERSGALITARRALEQKRLVYALPGNVGNVNSEASNLIIKNGAKLFTSADDIVRDFDKFYPGKLNPFALSEQFNTDMNFVLSELEVSSEVRSFDKTRITENAPVKSNESSSPKEEAVTDEKQIEKVESEVFAFDKNTLSLYKKIPVNKDCSVEDLIDESHTLRDVMQCLLKLEIAKFIVMLPGDRVKRNLK